jgi:peptidoglycan hydrolase-like protein with peptidoglycan-binding domain
MAFSLTWLPDVLMRAGLKVSLHPGWENRGNGDVSRIFGVVCHHTVGGRTGNIPTLGTLVNGRPARPVTPTRKAQRRLPGPLAQLGLARDGTFFVIAAGRANHAGPGQFTFPGNITIVNGNSNLIGIEGENAGGTDDLPWPAVQLEAYHRGVAAILQHIGRGADFCIAHKEWAPVRKPVDPRLNMNEFRSAVTTILNGGNPPVMIPRAEPPGTPGRPTIRRGMSGELTRVVQAKVGITVDGNFGQTTEAAVRQFQRDHGLVPDGIVGPKTWQALDNV